MCLAAAPAGASLATHVSDFGTPGVGAGQFDGPVGVALSPLNGDLYVTDYENNRVQRWTTAGVHVATFGTSGSGNGQFDQPYHVAIDNAGNVYVADFGNNRVQKFDASGTYLAQWGGFGTGPGQFKGATGIALSPFNGDLYVSDRDNHRVQRFTTAGVYVSEFGTNGSGDGQFNQPFGIGIDATSGDLFVADIGNFRVQRFTAAGAFVTKWGSSGGGPGQFSRPNGVAVGPTGNVFVTDVFNGRVEKFTPNGTYINEFGVSGGGPGMFDLTFGIWAEADGDLWITDYNNNRVQHWVDIETVQNVSAPTIGGAAYQGKTLTGNAGTWTGQPPITYVYEWLRCNAAGLACIGITVPTAPTASTTAPNYVVTGADIGSTLRLRVTADNAASTPAVADSAQTAIVNNYAGVVLGDGPLAFWRLGDVVGNPFMADSSGNGFNGEYKNGAGGSLTVGVSGDGDKVGVFAGNGTYGYVNGMSAPVGYHVSVEAWIKPSDLDPASIFHHGGSAALFIDTGQRLAFRPEDNRPDSQIDYVLPGGFDLSVFHHVAGTWNGRHATLYLDGAPVASGIRRGKLSGTATAYVGYGFLAPWFRGLIDEVAYYGKTLTAGQVLTHFTADPPPEITLVAGASADREPAGASSAASAKARAKAKAKARARANARARAKAKARAKQRKHRRPGRGAGATHRRP